MEIRQIRSKDGTGTLSYFLVDRNTAVSLLVDPNREDLNELREIVDSSGTTLTHVIDTHTHADHVSAAGELRDLYGARVVMHENTKNKWKVVDQGDRFGIGDILRANAAIHVDQYVTDGDRIVSGGMSIGLLFTPGHTDNHLALIAEGNLFTGDLLLIGQAGRSDLPGGDPAAQYDSLFGKIMPLPDTTRMYPGHDYSGNEYAMLGEEKRTNPFLSRRSRKEYIDFVKEFFPPIAESVAAGGKMTLQCGTTRVLQKENEIPTVTPAELSSMQGGRPLILDVREPSELALIGFIEGAKNVPAGQLSRRLQELPAAKDTLIVCVCQSGSRSLEATHFLLSQGFTNVKNLAGGTAAWIRSGRPVVRAGAASGVRTS
jgi:glyoxylase-like metal-dependent hydrolase (beta-lactamase superfamily II)/rhodanese-related sulfurtransferase